MSIHEVKQSSAEYNTKEIHHVPGLGPEDRYTSWGL